MMRALMRAFGWSIVCTVSLALAVSGAAAQEPAMSDESRQRFELAREAFERRDFATALTEWERVYALLDGHPRRAYILYNIARSHEELGRSGAALELYERFLREAGPDAPNRADAQRHANELRLRVSLERESEVANGGAFVPSPVGIAIGSVGAAAMIAGAIVGALALAQEGEARADCEGTRCTPDAHAALGEAGLLANAADGLLWGGLAVLATGAVLTFVLAETETSAACTSEGCAAFVRGAF